MDVKEFVFKAIVNEKYKTSNGLTIEVIQTQRVDSKRQYVTVENTADDEIERITRIGDQLYFSNEHSVLATPGLTLQLVESGLIL